MYSSDQTVKIKLKQGGQGMSILNDLKKAETPTDTSTSLMNEASIDMRNEFQKWLVDGNAKDFTTSGN